ncbi:UbiA family prenyltransferase [Methanolobus sp. WCC4]|uniref:UbiA family prenyltransferase n=1 Tax=Methanolobus sp. WCC4 TaxID=3125784 RepID=UPI0030F6DDF3
MASNVHTVCPCPGFRTDILKLFGLLWKEIVFGGHLFATGSVAVVIMCATLFGIPFGWDILAISYLMFYAIYLYDYSSGAPSDELTNSTRASYLQCKNRSMCMVIGASVLLVISLFAFSNVLTTLTGMLILALGLLYGGYFKKLTKKIPAFKNIFVSIVWAFMVLFVFVYYSLPVTYGALMLAIFIFIRMMNIQILFDVRDVEGDRAEGLLTVPAMFGEKRCSLILRLVNLLSIFYIAACVVIGMVPFMATAVIPVFYYGVGYINKVIRSKKNYMSYVYAACEPVMWMMLIVAGRFLTTFNVM